MGWGVLSQHLPLSFITGVLFLFSRSVMSNSLQTHALQHLLPSIFPSIRVFSNELALYQVANILELHCSGCGSYGETPYSFLD